MVKLNLRISIIGFFLVMAAFFLNSQENPYVYIYDDASDGNFGRSVNRGVIRGVRIDRFGQYRTLSVEKYLLDGGDDKGFLTPFVLSDAIKLRIDQGDYSYISRKEGLFQYNGNGIDFSFTLEKPTQGILDEIDSYYAEWPQWRDPVRNHYQENWVIRIHSAENVFEPWIDLITYNEALLAAALIADDDQWLWGVKDGLDILNLK